MRFRENTARRVGLVLGLNMKDLFNKSRFVYRARKDKGVVRGPYGPRQQSKATMPRKSSHRQVILLDDGEAFKAQVVLKQGNIMVVKVEARADA